MRRQAKARAAAGATAGLIVGTSLVLRPACDWGRAPSRWLSCAIRSWARNAMHRPLGTFVAPRLLSAALGSSSHDRRVRRRDLARPVRPRRRDGGVRRSAVRLPLAVLPCSSCRTWIRGAALRACCAIRSRSYSRLRRAAVGGCRLLRDSRSGSFDRGLRRRDRRRTIARSFARATPRASIPAAGEAGVVVGAFATSAIRPDSARCHHRARARVLDMYGRQRDGTQSA